MARPGVTLKLATSLDGRIAARNGQSKWITGDQARMQVHRLRAEHDAVMIGIGAAQIDDPMLNVRLDGYQGRQPIRVVLDSRLRLRPHSKLVKSANLIGLIVVSTHEAPGINARALEGAGAQVIAVNKEASGVAIGEALEALSRAGIKSVFAEGGGKVAASLIRSGAVDHLEWFRAPVLLGGDGVPAIGDLDLNAPDEGPRFHMTQSQTLGDDVWERYVPA